MNSRSSRRLFVTGIPADCPVSEVFWYFGQFGSLERIEVQLTVNHTRAFILTASDTASFEAILYPSSPHYYAGRFLQCEPFERGEALLKHNIRNNKKRVIIKRVPSFLSAEELRRWLESTVGQVQSMFMYSTDDVSKRLAADKRKYRSYSVIFLEGKSVSQLLQLQRIQFIPGMDYTIFEKFKPPRENRSKKVVGKPKGEVSKEKIAVRQKNSLELLPKSNKFHMDNKLFEHHNRRKSQSHLSKTKFQDVNSLIHGIKPCSKTYFSNRSRNLPSHSEESGNLLFKVVKHRV